MTDVISQEHYALVSQVEARMVGDGLNFDHNWDGVLSDLIDGVSAEFNRCMVKNRGSNAPWSFIADDTATERLFRAKLVSNFLPIDDCIEITAVRIVNNDDSTVQPLTENLAWYSSGNPIVGLYRIGGAWPAGANGRIGVTARWGYAASLPTDVTKQAITEVIREHLSANSGEGDMVGGSPFGKVKISNGFTDKTNDMLNDYSYGGAHLRG